MNDKIEWLLEKHKCLRYGACRHVAAAASGVGAASAQQAIRSRGITNKTARTDKETNF